MFVVLYLAVAVTVAIVLGAGGRRSDRLARVRSPSPDGDADRGPAGPALEAAAPPVSPSRLRDVAVIGVPAVVALALCLIELTTRSLWLDEAATVAIAGQHGSAFWHAAAHDGGNMLGYYALLHVLVGWFGDGAVVIRLPSAIASGAAAGAVALLGLRLFDRRVALAAGLLTAVSLPLVFWGQDARGYAAMVALVAGSFVAFAAIVDEPRRRGPWIAYVVLTTLSVYASYVAIFALPAQLLALALATDGVAPGARSDGGVRGVLDPARGARAQPRIGPAVLDRPAELQARAPGHRGAHLGRLRAQLPADGRWYAVGDPDRGPAALRRRPDRPATRVGSRYWRCLGWSFRSA